MSEEGDLWETRERKKTFGMGMKSPARNPAWISHIVKTLALMGPALKKIIQMGPTQEGIKVVKVWEIMMEEYS